MCVCVEINKNSSPPTKMAVPEMAFLRFIDPPRPFSQRELLTIATSWKPFFDRDLSKKVGLNPKVRKFLPVKRQALLKIHPK